MALTGEVDTSGLKNATALKIAKLESEIADIRLTFLSGKTELSQDGVGQSERLVELIRELEAEFEKQERPLASFAVHAPPVAGESEPDKKLEDERIEAAEKLLIEEAKIPVERILPGVRDSEEKPGQAGIYVEVTDPEN